MALELLPISLPKVTTVLLPQLGGKRINIISGGGWQKKGVGWRIVGGLLPDIAERGGPEMRETMGCP